MRRTYGCHRLQAVFHGKIAGARRWACLTRLGAGPTCCAKGMGKEGDRRGHRRRSPDLAREKFVAGAGRGQGPMDKKRKAKRGSSTTSEGPFERVRLPTSPHSVASRCSVAYQDGGVG